MAFAPRPALASPATVAFHIPEQPFDAALSAWALQSGMSLGRQASATCRGGSVGLEGRLQPLEGLGRLLRKSGCDFRVIDPSTVMILDAPRPKRRPAPSEVAAPVAEEDVVVTAARRRELIDRSPSDVTRVSAEDLEQTRTTSLEELAPFVAGMTVTNLGLGRDKIILRGLSDGVFTGRTQSTVSVYLDDVPLSYNAPNPDLRLYDIEGIEVLRGPQGALYGAGSIGGVVHIISNKVDLDHLSGSLEAIGSTTEGGSPSSVLQGVVNIPILSDRLGLRVAAYREADGGYLDDVNLGKTNANDAERKGGRAQLVFAINPNWTATLSGVSQSLDADDTQYTTGGLGPRQRDVDLQEPYDNDFTESALSLDGEGEAWRFKSTTAYVRHQLDSRYDASDAVSFFTGASAGATAFDENDRKDLLTEEITLASKGVSHLQWLAGVYGLWDKELSVSTLTDLGTPTAAPAYAETRHDLDSEYAAYGEATWNPIQPLFLTLGGRLFAYRSATNALVRTSAGARTVDDSVDNRGLAPKLVIRYDLNPSTMLYGQVTEGYRGGGVNTSGPANQTFGAPGAGPEPYQRYTGDNLWNYEVGTKLDLFSGRLKVRADLFYDAWRNIQTDQLLPSGLPFTANVGDGENKGVELEAVAEPLPGLTLRLDGAYNVPQLFYRNTAFPSLAEASLPGVSKGSFGVDAAYKRPLTQAVRGFVNAEAAYVGKSTISFDALTYGSMGDYWSSKLNIGVLWRNLRLSAFLSNPANVTGNTFAFGDPFSIRSERQTTPLRPRTFGLGLRADF